MCSNPAGTNNKTGVNALHAPSRLLMQILLYVFFGVHINFHRHRSTHTHTDARTRPGEGNRLSLTQPPVNLPTNRIAHGEVRLPMNIWP